MIDFLESRLFYLYDLLCDATGKREKEILQEIAEIEKILK